jgi:hypothetical protein
MKSSSTEHDSNAARIYFIAISLGMEEKNIVNGQFNHTAHRKYNIKLF